MTMGQRAQLTQLGKGSSRAAELPKVMEGQAHKTSLDYLLQNMFSTMTCVSFINQFSFLPKQNIHLIILGSMKHKKFVNFVVFFFVF